MPDIQTLSILGVIYYVSAIIAHILVLGRIIPYTSVNGGRSASFEDQAKLSRSNIVIAVFGIILMTLVGLIPAMTAHWSGIVIFGILSLFWLMGFVMQLLGTRLEKTVMSVIVLFGLYIHVSLLIQTIGKIF
jgi:hypothetical protein